MRGRAAGQRAGREAGAAAAAAAAVRGGGAGPAGRGAQVTGGGEPLLPGVTLTCSG